MSASVDVPGELLPAPRFGHTGAVAIRKANVPGWTPFKWQAIGKDLLVTGGIEARFKNGRPKWLKPSVQVVVTQAELRAQESRYEREHARCAVCFGTGQDWVGWSAKDGNRYEPCRACKATGRPKPVKASGSVGEGAPTA